MESKITKISYNEKDDILFIYRDRKVKGNIMLGNFVIDISYRGDMISIEVLDASKTLEIFKITKEMMIYASKAVLVSKKYPDGTMFMGFELISKLPNKKEVEEKAIVAVPELTKLKR